VVTAIQTSLDAPADMRPLTYLPLSLWPTFLAPLILATHVVIHQRVRPE
jgi:hypothetical protein